MIKNGKISKIEYIETLNAKKIIWIPLTSALLLIGSYITICNFVKVNNKKYLYLFIGFIISCIIVNFINLLYKQIKALKKILKEIIKDRDKIEINRDALIKSLDEKSSKLEQQEQTSYFLKCLFIDLINVQNEEQKQELIKQFFKVERKIKL